METNDTYQLFLCFGISAKTTNQYVLKKDTNFRDLNIALYEIIFTEKFKRCM